MRKRRTVRKQVGGNIFKKIWSGVKKAGNWINKAAKKTKIASTLLPLIPHPAAKVAGAVARQAGYGKKRKMVGGRRKKLRKQIGGSALTGRLYFT